jgi:general secretion pathway protein K
MGHERSVSAPGAILASHDGVVLLMVLWAMTILSAIVFSFSLMARTEAFASASFRGAAANRLLAEAGIERAIVEILYRNMNKGQQAIAPDGGEPVRIDGTSYTGRINNGRYTFRIIDETGKIPLNALTDMTGVVLKNLLVNMGYPEEEAQTVVDSSLDWRDEDELHRLYGAESDYYMSLPSPYKAKNGPFDTVEELLLVKGVTPAMLYGDGKRKGIIQFLTVSSKSDTINANAAPREVLLAIPGMTPEAVDYIIAQRQAVTAGGPSAQETRNAAALPGENNQQAGSFLTTGESNIFCIEATGNREGRQQGYGIRAIMTLDPTTGYRYVYYKSPAQVEP